MARISRPELAQQVVSLVGEAVSVRDIGTGWPSRILVHTGAGEEQVALHVSVVSPHARREWEWRFQNPASGTPATGPGGSLPLLMGLDLIAHRPILIVVDGRSRVGRAARFSILFNKRISVEAAATGWSEQVSTAGERIYALWPKLLPLVVEIIRAGVDISTTMVAAAAGAAGLLESDSEQAGERARRTVLTYIRDAKFSGLVKEAYHHRCAMCGVGLGVVAGAHIFPVSAPAAPDTVWNGVALCHNHHAAFDAHKIWIASDNKIWLRSDLVADGAVNAESSRFLRQTRQALWVPTAPEKRPRADMLRQRYEYYRGQYDWVGAAT